VSPSPASQNVTVVAGIAIPSTSPAFLSLVAAHVLFALAAVIAGALAMLSRKGPGRHPAFGTTYYWTLAIAVLVSLVLAGMRRRDDYPLAILGLLSPRLGDNRSGRTAASLVGVDCAPHRRHGGILYPDAHSVLCGQRQEPAALESSATDRLLAAPGGRWDADCVLVDLAAHAPTMLIGSGQTCPLLTVSGE
jgi:hypothetical protein